MEITIFSQSIKLRLVAVEGQEKSSTIERGMISSDTYIVFETSNSSGNKGIFLYLIVF